MLRTSKFRIWIASLVGILWCLSLPAQAGETRRQQFELGDNTERPFIQGIRPMGMGGAFTAVADDENALFYNPAGLARLDYWRFTLPHYLVGTDQESFDNLLYLVQNASAFSSFMSGTLDANTIKAVDELSNTRIHALNQTSMKYIQPNWGFGLWMYSDALVETGAILLPQANWNVKTGLLENISFGWGGKIPEFGFLAMGLGFKAFQQIKSAEENRSILDLQSIAYSQQWGGGVDAGLMYQPTDELTFAVVAQDLYTRLMEEVLVPNLKVGFAYKPWWLNFEDLASVLAVDVVELNWQNDNEFKNSPANASAINLSKVRMGVEFLLSGLLALRGGIHQGYPTAGISLVTSFINIDWAYFGRELGTYPGQKPEWNQRLSIDWHTGAKVAPPATPTPTVTPTATASPTMIATPTAHPTAQPTMTGNIPKLHGTFVGFTGNITVVPKLPDEVGTIQSWNFRILDLRGNVLKTYSGTGVPDRSFIWNAKFNGTRVSSKDQYPFTLSLATVQGEKTSRGILVIVDTIPKLYTSKSYENYGDKVYFSIRNPVKNTQTWKLDVFNAANELVRTYTTKDELFKAFAWDARDENGIVVPNYGSYRYELAYIDETGNQIVIADRIRPVTGMIYPSDNRQTIKIGEILFDTGKAYLTAEMFDKVIKSAYLVQDEPSSNAMIEGHTDNTGSQKLNMKLSLVRAESVRQFLAEEQNVPAYQMGIKGWGPTKPVATNRTAQGRERNRRVEIFIRFAQ